MSTTVLVYHADPALGKALCAALRGDGYHTYDPVSSMPDAYRCIARTEIDIAVLDEVPDTESVANLSDALELLDVDHIVINSETFKVRYKSSTWVGSDCDQFEDSRAQQAAVLSAMWTMHMAKIYTGLVGLAVA